jgi:hypothetical protein
MNNFFNTIKLLSVSTEFLSQLMNVTEDRQMLASHCTGLSTLSNNNKEEN